MTDDCGCDDEYGPCEDHGTTLVIREGASTRTADDLLLLLCRDACELLRQITREDRVSSWGHELMCRAEDLLAAEDHHGCRWFPESDQGATADELMTLRSQLEAELSTLDAPVYVIENDGYVMVQLHDDCPLLDEVQS